MKNRTSQSEKGLALVAVIAFTFIFTLVGFSMLHLAATEIVLTQKEVMMTTITMADGSIRRLELN